MIDNNQEPQRLIDTVPGQSNPDELTNTSRELGSIVVSDNLIQESETSTDTDLKAPQLVVDFEGDPSKVLGHPTNPMNGLGAALIRRSEQLEAQKAQELANQPPLKHKVTDGEGNLISPPPELISKTPWTPSEK